MSVVGVDADYASVSTELQALVCLRGWNPEEKRLKQSREPGLTEELGRGSVQVRALGSSITFSRREDGRWVTNPCCLQNPRAAVAQTKIC